MAIKGDAPKQLKLLWQSTDIVRKNLEHTALLPPTCQFRVAVILLGAYVWEKSQTFTVFSRARVNGPGVKMALTSGLKVGYIWCMPLEPKPHQRRIESAPAVNYGMWLGQEKMQRQHEADKEAEARAVRMQALSEEAEKLKTLREERLDQIAIEIKQILRDSTGDLLQVKDSLKGSKFTDGELRSAIWQMISDGVVTLDDAGRVHLLKEIPSKA